MHLDSNNVDIHDQAAESRELHDWTRQKILNFLPIEASSEICQKMAQFEIRQWGFKHPLDSCVFLLYVLSVGGHLFKY